MKRQVGLVGVHGKIGADLQACERRDPSPDRRAGEAVADTELGEAVDEVVLIDCAEAFDARAVIRGDENEVILEPTMRCVELGGKISEGRQAHRVAGVEVLEREAVIGGEAGDRAGKGGGMWLRSVPAGGQPV